MIPVRNSTNSVAQHAHFFCCCIHLRCDMRCLFAYVRP